MRTVGWSAAMDTGAAGARDRSRRPGTRFVQSLACHCALCVCSRPPSFGSV